MKTFDKHDYPTRRQMLKAGAAGLSGLAIAPSSVLGAEAGKTETKKIRYSDLLMIKMFRDAGI